MTDAASNPPGSDELACFLPALAKRRIAAGSEGGASHLQSFAAAVLFADISGFSKLANRLADYAQEGAEELNAILNAYYGPMVDVIQSHGGDIVNFAGDAILAVWPAEAGDLEAAVQRAAHSSLEVQRRLNNYEVAPGVRLSLRMAIGAGEMSAAPIGVDYRQMAIVGEPLEQLWSGSKIAQVGDVILSSAAWKAARGGIVGEGQIDGHCRVQSVAAGVEITPLAETSFTEAAAAALRSYVPQAVLARIDAGQGKYLADLRRVTVTFVKFQGVDARRVEPLERIMAIVQPTMARYEGTVVQLMADDKGTVGILCFGLPPLTHEDDAVRATMAAEAIQKEVHRHGWHAGIGVATGRVFCGPLGSPARRIYTIVGDKVNLAARLMQHADADILCDDETERATRGRVKFRPLPKHVIKGFAEPVSVCRPVSSRRGPEPELLVGRGEERAALRQALEEARGGASVAASIEGEGGIGKSTLLDSVLETSVELGLRPLMSACSSIERQTPYFVWRGIFAQLLELDAEASPAARRAKVLEQLPKDPERQRLAALLNPLLGVDFPTNEIVNQLDGRTRAENLHSLLLGMVETASARQPIVVVLDDVQWMDSASWRLLELCHERLRGLSVVIAMRPLPPPLPSEYTALLNDRQTRQVKLDFLSRADALELARRTLGVGKLSDRLADYLFDRSQGNPFFVLELSHFMRDAGLIAVTDGSCDLYEAGDAAALARIPTAISDLITSRIDQLTLSEQLTLKTASVIGRSFAHPTLQDVYPVVHERERLLDYLHMLERQELTRLEASDPMRRYLFRHVTIQQTAYDQLPVANRQELHREVALWFEARYGNDPSNFPLLAYHWGKAGAADKHIEYLAKAGEEALRDGANREAEQWFHQALERQHEKLGDPVTEEDRLRRGRWHRGRGDALYHLGSFPESRAALREALALLGRPVPNKLWKVGFNTLLQAVVQVGRRIRRRRKLPKPSDNGASVRTERLYQTSLANQRLARIGYFENQRGYALNHIFRAVNEGESAGNSPALSRAYGKMCVCMSLVPLNFMAEHYAHLAITAARATSDLASIADAQSTICMFRMGRGQWAQVAAGAEETVSLSKQLVDLERLAYGTTTLALQTCFQGQFEASLNHFTRLHEISSQSGNVVFQAWGLCGQAECQLRLGDLPMAIRQLEETNRLLKGKDDRTEEIRAGGLLALACWRAGQPAAGLAHAAATSELISQCTFPTCTILEGFAGPAEVYLDNWERAPAFAEWAAAATKAVRSVGWYAKVFPIGRPRALRLEGLVHWLSKRPRKAFKAWAESLASAERLELPFEAGLGHYELGRHTDEGGEDRWRHLEEAVRLFESLGTPHELRLAAGALDRSVH